MDQAMVHQTAPDAVRDPAGPHGAQGWRYLVDPDAGDHREDPEEVPEGGLDVLLRRRARRK